MGRNTQAIAPARRPSRAAPGPGTRRDGRSQAAISMRMRTASGAAISSMANKMTSAHTGSICTRSTKQPVQIEEANIRQGCAVMLAGTAGRGGAGMPAVVIGRAAREMMAHC